MSDLDPGREYFPHPDALTVCLVASGIEMELAGNVRREFIEWVWRLAKQGRLPWGKA